MDDETAFMQLVLANAQGELSPLEKGMHALAATEKPNSTIEAYATATGRKITQLKQEIYAARVFHIVAHATFSPSAVSNRVRHLTEIHAAPQLCWRTLVDRLVEHKWNVEQTKVAVRAVTSVKPPRGYESMFAIERLQEIAARGDDAADVVKRLTRAIERGRADTKATVPIVKVIRGLVPGRFARIQARRHGRYHLHAHHHRNRHVTARR